MLTAVRTVMLRCQVQLVHDGHRKPGGIMDKQAELELILESIRHCRSAVVTGPAAARLMGVNTLTWVRKTDVLLRNGAKPRAKMKGQLVYRSAILKPHEIREINGVAVVRPVRMLLDTLRYHGRLECLVALESLRNKWPDRFTQALLLESCETLPRAKGANDLRELIKYSADTSESPLETVARDRLLQLPEVVTLEPQAEIAYRGDYGELCLSRVDFLINGFLVAEVDGAAKYSGIYGDPRKVITREKTRENGIQAEGFPIVRGDWTSVMEGIFANRVAQIVRAEENRKYSMYRRGA